MLELTKWPFHTNIHRWIILWVFIQFNHIYGQNLRGKFLFSIKLDRISFETMRRQKLQKILIFVIESIVFLPSCTAILDLSCKPHSYRNFSYRNSYRNLIGKIPIRIDNSTSSYRLFFYLDKKDEIYHYSSKEHPKISKIAKFDCKML
jgi:hypothetical protein